MNKKLKILIGILLIIISYGFIAYKLVHFENIKDLKLSFKDISINQIYILFVVLLMMLLNWSIETYKWKLLIHKKQSFSFYQSILIVFASISMGIITPNRIGEVGGRAYFLDKGIRTYGLFCTTIGSFAQFISTIICGLVGSILFLIFYNELIPFNSFFNNVSISLLIIFIVFLLWTYFNLKRIFPVLSRFTFFRNRQHQLDYLSEITTKELTHILFLSLLRYIVFASQFFLILTFFKIELSYLQAFISISLIYLLSTLIPTTLIAELGIRGSLALFFIGIFSQNYIGILLSTFLLWMINLALPAIIGSIVFLRKQFF